MQALVVGSATNELTASGVTRVIAIESPALLQYSGDGYTDAIVAQLKALSPAAVLMPHTAMGRDLMPRVSAALGTGLVSDATRLHYEAGKFAATKPVYAGKAYLKSVFDKQPFCATVRSG